MKRSMITTPAGKKRRIQTTNGVNTTTTPFYLRDYKSYVPREDGYNEELADALWAQISLTPELWDQGAWRRFFSVDDTYALTESLGARGVYRSNEQVKDAMFKQLAQDVTDPTCGTAMCAAGWVGELTGADFVIDFDLARALRRANDGMMPDLGITGETIIVPITLLQERQEVERVSRESIDEKDWLPEVSWTSLDHLYFPFGPDLVEVAKRSLKKRGFTDATHGTVDTATWATWQLGLRDNEGSAEVDMFNAGNSLDDIEEHLNYYRLVGPWAHDPSYYREEYQAALDAERSGS